MNAKKEDYAEAAFGLSHLPNSREQQQAARDRRLKMTILKIAMLASVLVTSPAAAFAQAAPEGHSQAYGRVVQGARRQLPAVRRVLHRA